MFGIRFGSVQSLQEAAAGFRYVRLQFLNATTDIHVSGWDGTEDNNHRFGFLTTDGFLPAQRQTSETTPLVVTQSSYYGAPSQTYAGWRAFVDGGMWYTDTGDTNPWIQIDFGEVLTTKITGIRFVSFNINTNAFRVYTSLTGAFAGEETLIWEETGIVWTGGRAMQQFDFS